MSISCNGKSRIYHLNFIVYFMDNADTRCDSSRCFRVKCNNDFSSSHTCLCGVPQGSVLGPLLFVMYTTSLSTLVSSLSLNHHLYADDTQLFLSFHPSHFHSNISHLQNALQQITSWMTATRIVSYRVVTLQLMLSDP